MVCTTILCLPQAILLKVLGLYMGILITIFPYLLFQFLNGRDIVGMGIEVGQEFVGGWKQTLNATLVINDCFTQSSQSDKQFYSVCIRSLFAPQVCSHCHMACQIYDGPTNCLNWINICGDNCNLADKGYAKYINPSWSDQATNIIGKAGGLHGILKTSLNNLHRLLL